ncbi:MAG: hypothetical protein A2086_05310 [Spirochaetes bacterium GWD1_27_9]|nr:MAG: hypothetical protein A2Z98_04920 [Spirochaetes bacterium GWB1_27_13]OHD24663.1 MAG: hypothetical protein A2Y34_03380 [Spirochaetes bacterium GWC1_27_15]OHD45040.1 MAG: hypothetical protein A2086_05310 [Spirochaetes bacterium GWD1_27_9]
MNELEMLSILSKTLRFSSEKHKNQRRKNLDSTPYINHPIAVFDTLIKCEVIDIATLESSLLHDTIEDTDTTPEELENNFGTEVKNIVLELSDNKNLPKEERKKIQIEKSPFLSDKAKLIKMADHFCNISDIYEEKPKFWTTKRCLQYVEWSEKVIKSCIGLNSKLEEIYYNIVKKTKNKLK